MNHHRRIASLQKQTTVVENIQVVRYNTIARTLLDSFSQRKHLSIFESPFHTTYDKRKNGQHTGLVLTMLLSQALLVTLRLS